MPEVIINGPEGRLECRYMPGNRPDAPTAIILHPEPNKQGTMNNRITFALYKLFQARGFSVLRFNFRGVGKSQGSYDNGEGELADAATAMDWLQNQHPGSSECWIAGFSFGSWVGMQLMMRRPEITGFISASPPANMYDFSFLAPCPSSGLIINGTKDRIAPPEDTEILVEKLHEQKGITITHTQLDGAGHFYEEPFMDPMIDHVTTYVKRRLTENTR